MDRSEKVNVKCQACEFSEICTVKRAAKVEDNHFFNNPQGDHFCDWIPVA